MLAASMRIGWQAAPLVRATLGCARRPRPWSERPQPSEAQLWSPPSRQETTGSLYSESRGGVAGGEPLGTTKQRAASYGANWSPTLPGARCAERREQQTHCSEDGFWSAETGECTGMHAAFQESLPCAFQAISISVRLVVAKTASTHSRTVTLPGHSPPARRS